MLGPLGPFTIPSWAVFATTESFETMLLWAVANRPNDTTLFVHPNTGSVRYDHVHSPMVVPNERVPLLMEFFDTMEAEQKKN